MSVQDRTADFAIQAVYMWGMARLVRDDARRANVVDPELVAKLQGIERDLRAAADFIGEAWKMVDGPPISEAAE